MLKTAKNHPALSNHREHDHFNLNDKVVCYIGCWKENEHGHDIIVDDKFVEGVVINGYRHHDGCVSVCYDKKYIMEIILKVGAVVMAHQDLKLC